MKLIITRHGRTTENETGIIQGHLPGHLSETGIEQAKKVALRLKDEKIDFIYSSDLARTADTAKEISRFHPNTPITFVKELREIYLGAWQGKPKREISLTINGTIEENHPEDGETLENLYNRANNFLHKILLKHDNDTVLLAGHDKINKAMIAVITGKTAQEIPSIENQHNTSICILNIDETKNHTIHVFNCVKHLQ